MKGSVILKKQIRRFLCFFLCFCLCFAWFGEPMEAQAVAIELGWLTYVIISVMAAMGITASFQGGIEVFENAVKDGFDEWAGDQKDSKIIQLKDWITYYESPSGGPSGDDVVKTLLIATAAFSVIEDFIDWFRDKNGWNEGEEIVTNQSSYLVPSDVGTITVGGVTQQIQLCTNQDGSLYVGNDSSSFTAWKELNLGTFIPFSEGFSFQFGSVPFEKANTAFYYDLDNRTLKYEMYPSGTASLNLDSFITNSLGISLEEYAGMTFVLGCPRSGNTAYPQMVEVGFVRNDGTVKHCTNYYVFQLSRADALTYSLFDNVEKGYTVSVPDQVDEISVGDDQQFVLNFNGISGTFSSPEEFSDGIKTTILETGALPDVNSDVVEVTNPDLEPVPTPDVETDGSLEGNVSGILEWLKAIFNAILSIPRLIAKLILDGIKSIFLPDPEGLNGEFMVLLDEINEKYLFDFDLDSLFSSAKEPDDITAVYSVGPLSWDLTFVSWYYMKKGVEFFRPYIRGFIVLMLIFYNLRQFMSIFGLGGVMNGDSGDHRRNDLAV